MSGLYFQMKTEEQDAMLKELEASLQRSAIELDRKLTHQQQEYEKKIQVLMRQLSEAESGAASPGSSDGDSAGDKNTK